MAEKITPRDKDYSQWYVDIVTRADLADYAPVRGCMVIKPYGYAIWEKMQANLDARFKDTGHVNAYFPLLIPESFLKKEAEHVEGFAPECAVVTHGGGKELEEPLYIRPTSETIIWSAYKKWIQSYRDLPILVNQWCNVVRWEMRTRLFLRTTEFLWQEGHTAHATAEEAREETLRMLDVYRSFAEETMALAVLTGRKSDKEKFAGAVETYSIEGMMQDRKALQAGTSHFLGQNFAKAFDVTFLSREGKLEYVWASSWGVSTRLVGALVMAHSDDKGLVLPPSLAPQPVVLVPIFKSAEERAKVLEVASNVAKSFPEPRFVKVDDSENSPGWKFNEWEMRGVPVRIELGPKDLARSQAVLVRRDTGKKEPVALSTLSARVREILDDVQAGLLERSRSFLRDNTVSLDGYEDMMSFLDSPGGFVRAHWCGGRDCEDTVADAISATIRCIPLDGAEEEGKCIVCGKPSPRRVVFAKAY
ncbi:MAG: proline--tRNA ligase [Planctomycetota bacterium]